MSRMRLVTSHVATLGKATARDLFALCPDLTQQAVKQALNNAAYFGYLRKVDEVKPTAWGKGRAWAVYEWTGKPHAYSVRIPKTANSVFDLGRLAQQRVAASD